MTGQEYDGLCFRDDMLTSKFRYLYFVRSYSRMHTIRSMEYCDSGTPEFSVNADIFAPRRAAPRSS
ncbi:hypothetical protein D9615_008448 [Tricholomella constricta]|uniref:Uncharacterized protein n=1 Tax=Tricholomella constricta TaxID=117010 RepID=A0A8H5H3M1_9AGAR|nr:hypothetical protein D9615_008448 [Tricholomella constricta]